MPPRQGKTKGVHHHQGITTQNVKGAYLRKRRSKLNIKMTTNSQLSTTEFKKTNKSKTRTGKESDMEIIWRIINWEGKGKKGGKGQEIRSIIGRYKIDSGRLRIIWEKEKAKNLYV